MKLAVERFSRAFFLPVLMFGGKCSGLRAKAAHISAVAHFGGLLPASH